MHIVIAVLLFGAIVTIVLPYVSKIVTPMIPATYANNFIVQIALVGLIVFGALWVANKAGLGKRLSVGG